MVLIFAYFAYDARSACENKNYENLNDRKFCVNFDLATRGEDRIQTARVVQNL